MNLTTKYLGLELKNPIVPSASPLSKELGTIKALEDAGASAIVLYSLFEEQLTHEALELHYHTTVSAESYAEAVSYFPEVHEYRMGPEEYLEHIAKAKSLIDIPLIASLNGVTTGGWIDFAKKIEQAGADALELNVYLIATDVNKTSEEIEEIYIEILKSVKSTVKIPVAIKLSPFFSALAGFAKKLDQAGADGLILFNRFYQPDIDLENLEVVPNVILSTPQAMRLPLRWIAILYGKVKADLAATSGISSAEDVIKMIMAGAKVTQMFSALAKNGIGHITTVLNDMKVWMEEHDYESLEQMRGSMSHKSVANPAAFERANYMKALNTFKVKLI
ncbi:MAG: dihydroorotate dehydrogenase-like protein [Ignavibacteria bacterium]|nr:dihydroorotate dehydrogenase-like protein [Ignavibacteria bacterium]